jgi:hypothetical protein
MVEVGKRIVVAIIIVIATTKLKASGF